MNKKNLFRRVFESIAEGRSLQAQRYVQEYYRTHDLDLPANKPAGR